MKITKYNLIGHVHNNPDRTITHYASIPLGVGVEQVIKQIDDFACAFSMDFDKSIVRIEDVR